MHASRTCITAIFAAALFLPGACNKDIKQAPFGESVEVVEKHPVSLDPAAKDAVAKTAGGRVQKADIVPEEYRRQGSKAKIRYATIVPTLGNAASGLVAIIQPSNEDRRLRIVGKVVNIPTGKHGFHVHERGDCTAPDASSAGQHFDPDGAMHGDREAVMRHAGDLGNLLAADDQTAVFDFYDSKLSFDGVNSIIGKSFVINADADDLSVQPSGNSGARIACGVIENQ